MPLLVLDPLGPEYPPLFDEPEELELLLLPLLLLPLLVLDPLGLEFPSLFDDPEELELLLLLLPLFDPLLPLLLELEL